MNFPMTISRALAIGCLAASLAARAEEAAPAAPAPVRAQAEARVVVQAVPAEAPAIQVNEGVLRIEAGAANLQGEVRVRGGGQLIIQGGNGPVVIQEGGFFVGEGAPPAAATEKKPEAAETEDRVDFLNKDRLRGLPPEDRLRALSEQELRVREYRRDLGLEDVFPNWVVTAEPK